MNEIRTMYDKATLCDLFRERALKFGDFTLASGKKATYYLDGKQITLHARGLKLVSEGLLELLDSGEIDAVGGMSIGADPIVAGVLSAAADKSRDLLGFLVRKESKGHGTNKFVEGPLQPGMKVAIVEDVVTTGGSSLLAVDRVEEFGCKVIQVLAIIDRMEGGAKNFAARNIPFQSLLTIEDFGITPPVLAE
ncbi:orotate phosphoribosyltransferase [Planctomicrobium sp. SH668]|uniref:orotate phosphoribosyltransferase n=1 Tax=Planctomicrobium sp. SH668 TaxID=3448126 RepID=UPI003F5BDA01